MTKKEAKLLQQNEEFEKLGKREKRVVIAKDVIKHLNTEKLIAECGIYYDQDVTAHVGDDLQKVIRQAEVGCTACAIGGTFFAAVYRSNDYKVDRHDLMFGQLHVSDKNMRAKLRKFFRPMQLAYIESAFEGHTFAPVKLQRRMTSREKKTLDLAAMHFNNLAAKNGKEYYEYEDDSDFKLRSIMENIIENNGTFKPCKEPKNVAELV